MCSNIAPDTNRNDSPYVLSYITVSPTNELSISNMSVFFVHWALINIFISLVLAQPSNLEYPRVQANRFKTKMTCYTVKLLILANSVTFSMTFGTLLATKTLFLCGLPLTVVTAAPKMEKKQNSNNYYLSLKFLVVSSYGCRFCS